jgi:hypothetical protein
LALDGAPVPGRGIARVWSVAIRTFTARIRHFQNTIMKIKNMPVSIVITVFIGGRGVQD